MRVQVTNMMRILADPDPAPQQLVLQYPYTAAITDTGVVLKLPAGQNSWAIFILFRRRSSVSADRALTS
jgi:hypothetical protein